MTFDQIKRFLLFTALLSSITISGLFPAYSEQINDAKNTKRCVEFFIRNGQQFCNTTITQRKPDLAPAAEASPIAPVFDNRHWRLRWWNQNSNTPIIEYGVNDEPLGAWTELVTAQYQAYTLNSTRKMTPQETVIAFLLILKKQGFQPEVNIINEQKDDVIFEWRIKNHPVENQHEIMRCWSGQNGIYVLHYASRPTMSEKHRTEWIELISKAQGLR